MIKFISNFLQPEKQAIKEVEVLEKRLDRLEMDWAELQAETNKAAFKPFNTQQELWEHLIAGGIIKPKLGNDRDKRIELKDGNAFYINGESAYKCMLTPEFWSRVYKGE